MEIKVKEILNEETEYIEIGCHRRDSRVEEIIRFVKLHHGSIEATREEKKYQIPLSDIYYIEAVDDRTFIYLGKNCYESHKRLYEFEELLSDRSFARISKSVVVNLFIWWLDLKTAEDMTKDLLKYQQERENIK